MDVKTLRRRMGMTQRQMADLLEVSVLSVKSWEAGQFSPRGKHKAQLERIADANRASAVALPAPSEGSRRWLTLGEAVRLMGLRDGGHGKRSDRTIRNALKSGALHGWKAPGGYRRAIAEWCFYADDFDAWRSKHYHAQRDPRGAPSAAANTPAAKSRSSRKT
jgi:DNA-binding XRE family transcriptional regulator